MHVVICFTHVPQESRGKHLKETQEESMVNDIKYQVTCVTIWVKHSVRGHNKMCACVCVYVCVCMCVCVHVCLHACMHVCVDHALKGTKHFDSFTLMHMTCPTVSVTLYSHLV